LGPNTLLSILFSNTLSLRFSVSVIVQVLRPNKRTDKIVVLYISFFVFLDGDLKDKRLCT
jgi:hypothetical protein